MADKKKSRTMSDALFGGKGSYKGGPSYKKAMERRKRKEEIEQAKKEMADFYKNKDKPAKVKKNKPKKQKDSPTVKMKGVKLDRERGDSSKKLKPKTMTAEERKAAGRTKQSRRDLRDPTLMGRRQAGRSFPTFEEGQKQSAYSRKFGGSDKLLGGISIPAIAKAKPAFTEVERPPKTTIDGKRLMKAGGRIRMDGTAKPR